MLLPCFCHSLSMFLLSGIKDSWKRNFVVLQCRFCLETKNISRAYQRVYPICEYTPPRPPHTHSWFSLFTVVTFYKITANSKWGNIEPLPLMIIEVGSCVPLVMFSPIDEYITLFHVRLFKDTLLNIYYWFINTELLANSMTTAQTGAKLAERVCFLHKVHQGHLGLRNTTQTFSTVLEGRFKQQNHRQKVQKYKHHDTTALNRPGKGNLLWESKENAEPRLVWPQPGTCTLGDVGFFSTTLPASANDHENTALILRSQINFSK